MELYAAEQSITNGLRAIISCLARLPHMPLLIHTDINDAAILKQISLLGAFASKHHGDRVVWRAGRCGSQQ